MLKLNLESNTDGFVEVAKQIAADTSRLAEAREVCFRGLTANPANKLGRLLLARLFYQDKMYEFAARELAELANSTDAPSVAKLLAEFGPIADKYLNLPSSKVVAKRNTLDSEPEGVVAELDLDASFLDIMNELKAEEQSN